MQRLIDCLCGTRWGYERLSQVDEDDLELSDPRSLSPSPKAEQRKGLPQCIVYVSHPDNLDDQASKVQRSWFERRGFEVLFEQPKNPRDVIEKIKALGERKITAVIFQGNGEKSSRNWKMSELDTTIGQLRLITPCPTYYNGCGPIEKIANKHPDATMYKFTSPSQWPFFDWSRERQELVLGGTRIKEQIDLLNDKENKRFSSCALALADLEPAHAKEHYLKAYKRYDPNSSPLEERASAAKAAFLLGNSCRDPMEQIQWFQRSAELGYGEAACKVIEIEKDRNNKIDYLEDILSRLRGKERVKPSLELIKLYLSLPIGKRPLERVLSCGSEIAEWSEKGKVFEHALKTIPSNLWSTNEGLFSAYRYLSSVENLYFHGVSLQFLRELVEREYPDAMKMAVSLEDREKKVFSTLRQEWKCRALLKETPYVELYVDMKRKGLLETPYALWKLGKILSGKGGTFFKGTLFLEQARMEREKWIEKHGEFNSADFKEEFFELIRNHCGESLFELSVFFKEPICCEYEKRYEGASRFYFLYERLSSYYPERKEEAFCYLKHAAILATTNSSQFPLYSSLPFNIVSEYEKKARERGNYDLVLDARALLDRQLKDKYRYLELLSEIHDLDPKIRMQGYEKLIIIFRQERDEKGVQYWEREKQRFQQAVSAILKQ